MHKHTITWLIVLIGIIALTAIVLFSTVVSPAPSPVTVSGSVTYRERMALPPGGQLIVQLQNDDETEILDTYTLSTDNRSIPFKYTLNTSAERVDPNRTYYVAAEISLDGKPLFASTQPVRAVVSGESVAAADIVLSRSSGDTQPGMTACTAEAMQCPDGSYVGRTGPNCEFAACPSATNTATSTADAELEGNDWVWQRTIYPDGGSMTPNGSQFVLSFSDGNMESTTDCNSLRGTYTQDGARLTFSDFATTLMFCEDSLESGYSSDLSRTTSFSIDGSQLQLNLDNDTGRMYFERR